MSPLILALVLTSALVHASWNAMLRSAGDRFRSIVIMDLAAVAVCLPFLFILPMPHAAGWFYILLSSAIHIGYSMLLVDIYRHGELGHVYPVARGSSPLLVALGAALFAHEHLTPITLTGIALVSLGILSLATTKHTSGKTAVLMALATGVSIAAYTVTDGLGGRASGNPVSYSAWLFVIYGIALFTIYRFKQGPLVWKLKERETRKAIIGGVISIIGYTIIIWAMTSSLMGPVSALRETSVVFAAFIGRFFLAESLTTRRLASCVVIAAGAACLG